MVRSSLIALVAATTLGCATASVSREPTIDVTGAWSGAWVGAGGGTGRVDLQLRQEGVRVTGAVDFSSMGSMAHPQGPLYGEVSGSALAIERPFRAELAVTGDEMNGIWRDVVLFRLTLRRQR